MSTFLFGVVVGAIAGGFFINVDLRCPAPIKEWLKSFFGYKDDKPAEPAVVKKAA